MALQLGALRAALLDAGSSPETADRAAEELAGYDNLLAGIDTRLGHMDGRLNQMDARLGYMDWKINAVMAVVVLMLGSQFLLWSKIGEISGQLAQIAGRLP